MICQDNTITEKFLNEIPESYERTLPDGEAFENCNYDPQLSFRNIRDMILPLIPVDDGNHFEMIAFRFNMIAFIVDVKGIKQYSILPIGDCTAKHCTYDRRSLYFLLRTAGIEGLCTNSENCPPFVEMLKMFMKR